MRRFLVRRVIFALLSFVGATLAVFALAHAKEDPINLFIKEGYFVAPETLEQLREKWGLDRPLVVQYFVWLKNVVTGDLGRSLQNNRPVFDIMRERWGATIQLAIAAWCFGTFIGIPLGVLSALKRGSIWDYLARGLALFGQSLPGFWIGLVGILIFAVWLQWLPVATRGQGQPFFEQIKHYILPSIVLGWAPMAAYLRLTRSAMLEVLDSEYVKLARAKGVNRTIVIWKHGFRNALIQPLTVAALLLAGFMDGAVLVELIFAWPGVGRVAVEAVTQNDFQVITGSVLLFTMLFVVFSFIADMVYVVIDPRIRYR
jgi:peptide/nickel transport system permease protein